MGEAIRSARTRAGLSQVAFARRCGVSQQFVSAVEGGIKTPSVETLRRIREVVGGFTPDEDRALRPIWDLDTDDTASPGEIRLSASGTDLDELRQVDPDAYELIMVQARAALERARARGRR